MEVEISGKKYQIKEMSYLEALELDGLSKADMAKKMILCCTDLTEEGLSDLSIKDGMELQNKINEANRLEDFQNPVENKELDQS